MKKSFISVFLFLLLAVVILLITGCPWFWKEGYVKNEPPEVNKVSGPDGEISENSSTFTWTGKEYDGTITKYEYRKDEGSWESNATNTSYTWNGYSEGPHKFEVRAKDDNGKYSTAVSWIFTYNKANQPPVVAKVSGPNGETSENGSTFTWTGSDPDGIIENYLFRKDDWSWESNGTGTSYTWNGYSEGPHKFEVRAQDNEGAYSNIVSWSFTYSTGVGEMVLVEGGTFMMGDEFGDLVDFCRPVHEVTLTYDFYIGKYETTFDEYDAFCVVTGRSKPNDEGWGRGSRPVIYVSWRDAIAYCNWLSEKEGLPKAYDTIGNLLDKDGKVTTDITKVPGYRLPTEAEWEYAARGGNDSNGYMYSGSDDVDEVAWYYSNSGDKTHEVGKKAPNELGIYDMSGNVWEWCSDWWYDYTETTKINPYNGTAGSYRVERGGSWYKVATCARVANRGNYSPTETYSGLGFRICRTVP